MKTLATLLFGAIFGAVLASAFWIWFYSLMPTANDKVEASGDIATVDRPGSAPIAIAEGLEIGPAGLAIPVV